MPQYFRSAFDAHLVNVRLQIRIADLPLTHWTAPEVYAKKSASKASDIWQVGITALEMVLLAPPYGQYPYERALQLLAEKVRLAVTAKVYLSHANVS